MVDTITYIVCAGLGLAIDGESVPYVAGWGEDGALDSVSRFAATIDQFVRQIENAITDSVAPAAPRASIYCGRECRVSPQ
jgi:hypothetical protein